MSREKIPPKFLALLKGVEAKRPRTVIDHILEHGQITTEDLRDIYGYNHPPRAIRDVREQGIPVTTFRVTGSDGRKIAAYKFGDPSEIRATHLSGRTAFSSKLKASLIELHGARCNIYCETFPERDLQIDHRIPFGIAGDIDALDDVNEYMLLCASANRAKSWSCENCANWTRKEISVCESCYWAFPESYSHVAMRDVRRLDILWADDEVSEYDRLQEVAAEAQENVPEYVKNVLRAHFRNKDS
ncbi:MAG: HNH endonuclease [Candidatus Poribacteria bacterium]|nr:HNH endonuclease [Candidatus Poribacteria bacterium]